MTPAAKDRPGADGSLRRWRLDISYDGTDFSGWASQPGLRTVQGELEHWITRVLRLPEPVRLVCAGRTDAGVHARGQVAHLDLPADLPDARTRPEEDLGAVLLRRLARVLDPDLAVTRVSPAPAEFDARFAAVWRRYCYRLWDGAHPVDPLYRHQVTTTRGSLDLAAMNAAGESLIGLRDFAAFCKRRDGATTIRTLLDLHGTRVAEGPMAGVCSFTVRADAFCHSMVRSVIGALVAVGLGHREIGWVGEVAARKVRDPGIQVLPAHGLTLEEVGYPPDDQLGDRVAAARAVREAP